MSATTTVLTGMGIVAPTGVTPHAHWQALLEGRSGVGPIRKFDPSKYPVRLAGQVQGFSSDELLPPNIIPQTDIGTQMGLVAAADALEDAGIVPSEWPEYELAVVTASSSGGTEFGQHEMERLYLSGPDWVGAYQSIAWFYAATTGQISIRHGTRGPSLVVCQEQAGGLDAFGHARKLVAEGSRVVVVGGSDASLCPYGLTAQLSSRWLTSGEYRPYAKDATGYVPGEGGAMLVAEPEDSAKARGAEIYAVVKGHASGFDPPPGSERPSALRRTIEAALCDANIDASNIDVVLADGIALPDRDIEEVEAISSVFGTVPVTVPKTMTGRMYAGGGAVDVVTGINCIRHNIIPHTPGTSTDYDIDLVKDRPRECNVRAVLLVARGYGGFVSSLVLAEA